MAYLVTWVQDGTQHAETVSPSGARVLAQYLQDTFRIRAAVERI